MTNEPLLKKIKHEYFWYAIYTKSRSEKKLHLELQEKGIESYLPLKKELRIWSDRKKWVEAPLFSSYVFVKVSKKEYQQAIGSQYAVCYVSIRGKAVPVHECQINALKSFLEDEARSLEVTNTDLKPGKRVEVLAGPLKGVQGEILEIRGKHRLVLRFESLGACVHTEIQTEEIKLVDSCC
ncbi:UpxY family transcription antiterminator [Marinifilum sp. D737]|uniref:UpxY family transcription antiterminator n=1 Tax=Marinifilum sp. D737 TaxID=2969628 RepID=UPI002274A656|nr:UpxY family transcription antiterminator [Marinifilum sp. D737]MCY1634998.1 UpxY family transcription antiterminator [Marinifilum sp. D737]